MDDRIIVCRIHPVEDFSHLLGIMLVTPAFSTKNVGEVKLYTRDRVPQFHLRLVGFRPSPHGLLEIILPVAIDDDLANMVVVSDDGYGVSHKLGRNAQGYIPRLRQKQGIELLRQGHTTEYIGCIRFLAVGPDMEPSNRHIGLRIIDRNASLCGYTL